MKYLTKSVIALILATAASTAGATNDFLIDQPQALPASMPVIAAVATPVLILDANGVVLQYADAQPQPVFDLINTNTPNFGLAIQLIAPGPNPS